MKVPTVATTDFNQKASCLTPRLSLGYLFRRIFQHIVDTNLSWVAEEFWVEQCP